MIWYQQEVNQFAVMHPEERFRIFSEIHGIDRVQRDWEESLEKMKETEETLRGAELNVKWKKADLSIKKAALDRFEDNQKRLREGGELYLGALFKLEKYFLKEKDRLLAVIEQLEDEITEAKDASASKQEQKEQAAKNLETVKDGEKDLEESLEDTQDKLDEATAHLQEIKAKMEDLEKELESITQRKSQITRTEEEVKAELYSLMEERRQTDEDHNQAQSSLHGERDAWQGKVVQIAELREQVSHAEKREALFRETLRQYKNSFLVQERIIALEKAVEENKDKKREFAHQLTALQDELGLLEEERDLSARQRESMKWFRSQQIKAYALRELIEMDETARLKDEQMFQTIKYTIFFNGTHVHPPNDLYHVPLMKLIPNRSITQLPALHLKIKQGLREEEIPHAIKALWWVEQLFRDGAWFIRDGVLIDSIGLRDPQEKDRYILSAKALQARKQEVRKQIGVLIQNHSLLEKQITADTKAVQEANSIIQHVREAEAFMTNEYERVLQKEKLKEEQECEEQIKQAMERLDAEIKRLVRLQIQQQAWEKELREAEDFYKELGKLKDKYEELHELRRQVAVKKEEIRAKNAEQALLENDLDLQRRKINRLERELRRLSDELDNCEVDLRLKEKQKENYGNDSETTKQELIEVMWELNELKNIIPDRYAQVFAAALTAKPLSISQMRSDRERGQVMFNQARREEGIDPAAPENYETTKNECERLDDEFKRTSLLLEQDRERADQLRDNMETTINMRVLELQQRFKMYMSQFQFEGDISWESLEDQRKRIHFKLYIKARKEGHRGSLEDVSVKARGGKVGKGVSGGEESLSSLLFALALLQNLQTTPGFIVLDEFDSALDENRKSKVFDLYERELRRKLIILTPKSHEQSYLNRFSKAFIVHHDPMIPKSKVVGIVKVTPHSQINKG